jgi:orotate phosphoribosyltransferase
VDALTDAGATVLGVLAIFQYGFPQAAAAFVEAGVPFDTLTDYQTLIQEAAQTGAIAPQELNTLSQWSNNPQGWGALYA